MTKARANPDDPVVRIEHVRAAFLCTRGARRWFQARDLDWTRFLSDGLPASVIGQWDDPLAARAIEQAIAQARDGG